jgi:lysyl oxidase
VSTLRRSPLVVCALALVLPLLAVPAEAAPDGTPRLGLRAASRSVELVRYGRGPVWLDLGVSVISKDAPFELRVHRETYDDPIRVWQAFHGSGGVVEEELPADILEGWTGLDRFLRITLFDRSGNFIRARVPDACLGGWQTERVDDSGPFDPTYPAGCGTNPLTRGAVWGIDQGWGVTPLLSDAFVRVPNGRYVAKVSITARYRTLFGVAPGDAAVSIAVRIRTSTGCLDFCEGRAAAVDPPARRMFTPAVTTSAPDPSTVPDLVALPAYGIGTSHQRRHDYLQFGADVWNGGPASLVVEGFRAVGEDRMDAYQYFLADGVVVGRAPVGSFLFDRRDGHQHWHFLQFARYRLLDASQNAIRSHKQAFCLAPTDPIDLTADGAIWRPDQVGFSQCGGITSLWIREVLPAGWGDTYFQSVPGQSFDITGLPNGSYWIEVHANPAGVLFDADPSNDVELREVILRGVPGARTVSVPPWHGIDTEAFIGFGP